MGKSGLTFTRKDIEEMKSDLAFTHRKTHVGERNEWHTSGLCRPPTVTNGVAKSCPTEQTVNMSETNTLTNLRRASR